MGPTVTVSRVGVVSVHSRRPHVAPGTLRPIRLPFNPLVRPNVTVSRVGAVSVHSSRPAWDLGPHDALDTLQVPGRQEPDRERRKGYRLCPVHERFHKTETGPPTVVSLPHRGPWTR